MWRTRKQPPDVWGAANRIYGPGTAVPGRRDPRLTPYNIPFGHALQGEYGGKRYKRAVLVEGAQNGKTEGFLDAIGERLDNRPAPMLYVGPSKEFVTDQFEPRLTEMFSQSASLIAKMPGGLDSKKQKKTLKRIAGTRLRLAHAGSSTALKSDQAALALVDEYDEMLKNVKGQGDPLGLIEARGDTYADFVCGVTSTPSLGMVQTEVDPVSGLEFWRVSEQDEIQSPIWKLWQSGTRFHWTWKCPHCAEWFVPRGKLLRFAPSCTPEEAARTATLECPNNGCVIEERYKAQMNANGLAVAPGQRIINDHVVGDPPDSNTFSLWVSGLCSPFKTFGDRAAKLVEARRTGESAKIQTAVNSQLGECYVETGGDLPTWEVLKSRALDYELNTVPDWVRFITAGIDVQKSGCYFVSRGWGPRATSVLVNYGLLQGDTSQFDFWDMVEELLRAPIGDTTRKIKLAFIDSGFRPGKKFQVPVNRVYEFCRRMRHFVYPTKGSSTAMVRPIVQGKLEVNKKGEAERYGLDLMRLDTDHWKRFVHERLNWDPTKQGAWHTSKQCDDAYFKQIVAETRVIVDGKPKWLELARDNHYLDCEAMAAACAYMLNAQYLSEPKGDEAEDKAVEIATISAEMNGAELPPAAAAKQKMTMAERLAALSNQLNR